MKLTIDNDTEFECDQAIQAMDWVDRLDGRLHTEVCLGEIGGWSLIIGGGPDLFVAVKFDNAGNSFSLLNPAATAGKRVELRVGGQPGDFEPAIVCPLPMIAQAIMEFFVAPSAIDTRWLAD